jgi:hypothetical protein
MVVSRGNAPRSSAYRAGALLLSYETEINREALFRILPEVPNLCFLIFRTGARRAKQQVPLYGRSNSDDSNWFVALAKEQLTLVTHDGFHGISFC